MVSLTWLVAVLVSAILYVQVHGQSSELRVVFAEVDFREIEGVGAITATIIKEGPLLSDLVMNIIPLTYEEFDIRGFPLGEDQRRGRPDPAEYEINGRMDFNNTVQQLVLRAGITSDDYSVSIPVTTDSFNEASEGFMIVMRPDEARSNPEDVANIVYQNGGVALGVIDDDDSIVLGFERTSYSVQEVGATVLDLVALVKQEGQITEQTIIVAVNSFDISADEELDYRRIEQLAVTFLPEQMRITLPFTLIDDRITEPTEAFGLLVSRKLDNPNIVLGIDNAIISIFDEDVVVVRFNETIYIVNEGDTVTVCVDIVGSNPIDDDLLIFLSLTPVAGTASGDDYTIPNNFLALNNELRQSCVEVDIVSDNIPESTENLTLTITNMTPNSDNIITTTTTTIIINSNECEEGTNDCFDDSFCTDTVLGFKCRCPPGYLDRNGDGRNCVDIDECLEDPGNCDANAICVNTPGSFQCQCVSGFRGDGRTCTDVNECEEGLDNCDPSADCLNTAGSFECQCREGFIGDGIECMVLEPPEVNECQTGEHDCSPLAKCIDLEDGFKCRCKPGYIGNGRICRDVNECTVGLARCYPHSQCVNQPGSYRCVCDPGYSAFGRLCVDINECRYGTHSCDANARCVNTPGSFRCVCNDGFTGNGFTCTAEQLECGPGYRPRGQKCMDINECREGSDECDDNALCTNTLGSYRCTCLPGFTGNGFTCTATQLIDPCDQQDEGDTTTGTRGTKTSTRGTKSRKTDRTTKGRGRRWARECRQSNTEDSSRGTTRGTTRGTKTTGTSRSTRRRH